MGAMNIINGGGGLRYGTVQVQHSSSHSTVQLENRDDASAKKGLTQCGRSHKRYAHTRSTKKVPGNRL